MRTRLTLIVMAALLSLGSGATEPTPKAYQTAKANKERLLKEIAQEESAIEREKAEEERLSEELEFVGLEITTLEKSLTDLQNQTQKAKDKNAALRELHEDKAKKLRALIAQRDETRQQIKDLDDERAQAEIDFEKLKEKERTTSEDLEIARVEQAQKQAKLEAYISETKLRSRVLETQLQIARNEDRKLKLKTKAFEKRAAQAERELAAIEKKSPH